jgi:SPP1 gp7 family putative phage head morphogenesis protein
MSRTKRNKIKNISPRGNVTLAATPSQQAQRRVLQAKPKAIYRTRQDVLSWNRALNLAQAEEPRNYAIQILFDEIMTDALLYSQVQNRDQQIYSIDIALKKPNGETDEEQTRMFKNHPLYRFLTQCKQNSRWFMYDLVELSIAKDVNGKTFLVGDRLPRTNVVPQLGLFFPDYTDEITKIPYREMPEFGTWILEYYTKEMGLLNKAVPHVLFKRFAQSCWSELCEIYGIPPRVLKTDTADKAMLARAETMMADMGAASWFVIDSNEEFQWATGVTTNGDVYKNLIDHCRNELCLLIVGAVISQDTKNGSYGKDDAAQEMLWQLVQADMAMLSEMWNTISIPALVKHGVLKGDLTFEFVPVEDIDKLFSMVKDMLNQFEFDIDWLNEKFGLQIIGQKSGAAPADPAANDPAEGEPGKAPAKKSKQAKTEKKLSWLQQFLSALPFFQKAPAKPTTGAHLMANCCGTPRTINLKALDKKPLIQELYEAAGKGTFNARLFAYTAQTLIDGMYLGWQGKAMGKLSANIGITYGVDDPALLTAFEMNLFRFSGTKTLAEVQAMNELYRNSKSFEEFERGAQDLLDKFNSQWLQTEYSSAYLTGEAAANYARLMAQIDTFPYWEYKTVDDDRVRPEHRALHGLILPANDPRWRKLFPPNAWNCRCFVVGRTKAEASSVNLDQMRHRADEYLTSNDFERDAAQGWGVNRAEAGEVFTANQQYMRKFPNKAAKMLNELGAPDYGLPSYSNAKKVATEELPQYEGNAGDFYDQLEQVDGKAIVRDYNNRPVALEPKKFKAHTTGKKESRVPYLDAMTETLKAPDEVWFNAATKGDKDNMISIKYYKDKTLIVVSSVQGNKVYEVNTWYDLTEKKETIERVRRGLLVFAKK